MGMPSTSLPSFVPSLGTEQGAQPTVHYTKTSPLLAEIESFSPDILKKNLTTSGTEKFIEGITK